MTKCLRLAALLSIVVACKSTWTQQRIHGSTATGESVLKTIEVLAQKDPGAQARQAEIQAAIETARTAAGDQQLNQALAAERAARDGDWDKAVAYLRNEEIAPPPDGDDGCGCATQRWPDVMCGPATAREWLEMIRINAQAAPDSKRQRINELIDKCLTHPNEFPHLTLGQHCDRVLNALGASTSSPPDWNLCIHELDHEVGTGGR